MQGATTLNRNNRALEASDLGAMYVSDCLIAHKRPASQEAVTAIETIANSFQLDNYVPVVGDASTLTSEQKETKKTLMAKISFLRNACSWIQELAKADTNGADEYSAEDGSRKIHMLLAQTYELGGEEFYSNADALYSVLNCPKVHGEFSAKWAKCGNKSELDLFLARSVLQYLANGELGHANAFRDAFLAAVTADESVSPDQYQTPLSNFIKFLLLTLERDARPLFEHLVDKYKPSISRDPTFEKRIKKIGEVFYNIRDAPRANSMENMMNSLMGMMGGGGAPGGNPFLSMLQNMGPGPMRR